MNMLFLALYAACPSPQAVETAMHRLQLDTDAVAQVTDFGAAYRVVIGDMTRDIADPERRCEERARTVAVMLAMTAPARVEAAPPPEEDPALTPTTTASTPVVVVPVVVPIVLGDPPQPTLKIQPQPQAWRWKLGTALGTIGGGLLTLGLGLGLGIPYVYSRAHPELPSGALTAPSVN